MNILDFVTACFFTWETDSKLIFVRVGKYDDNGDWFNFTLADQSHQALIETLNVMWPNWTDTDQDLARSE
ncbi:MAG: hypothetical protein V3V74_04635 [Nitrosomonadaceae bacterium]